MSGERRTGIMGPVRATGTTGPRLVAADDPALTEAVAGAERVLVDVGCGDGRHTVRWAEREPAALVVGVDAETTRLDRALAGARRRRLTGPLFVTWSMGEPLPALTGRCAGIAVVMPWGSLLDGVLGGDDAVLRSVLALGAPGAALSAVVNVRPWAAPASVDRKLAATPEPTRGAPGRPRRPVRGAGLVAGRPGPADRGGGQGARLVLGVPGGRGAGQPAAAADRGAVVTVRLVAAGHPAVTGRHGKTLELTTDPDITARASCVLGTSADPLPGGLERLRGRVRVRLAVGDLTAVVEGEVNPAYASTSRLVVRRSDVLDPDTFLVNASAAAADLDRALVARLRDPAARLELTAAEIGTPPPVLLVLTAPPPRPALAALAAQVDHVLDLGGPAGELAGRRHRGIPADPAVLTGARTVAVPVPDLTALTAAVRDRLAAALPGARVLLWPPAPGVDLLLAAGRAPAPVLHAGRLPTAARELRPGRSPRVDRDAAPAATLTVDPAAMPGVRRRPGRAAGAAARPRAAAAGPGRGLGRRSRRAAAGRPAGTRPPGRPAPRAGGGAGPPRRRPRPGHRRPRRARPGAAGGRRVRAVRRRGAHRAGGAPPRGVPPRRGAPPPLWISGRPGPVRSIASTRQPPTQEDPVSQPSPSAAPAALRVPAGTTAAAALEAAGVRTDGSSGAVVVRELGTGALRDLAWAPEADAEVEPVPMDSPDGRAVLRHSTAHVLAQAVQDLFPGTRLGIGPPIDNGFYYDFLPERPFTPDDLARIEQRMQEIVKAAQRFARRPVSDDEARAELAHEPFKLELIDLKGAADDTEGASAEVGAGQLTMYDNLDRSSGERVWTDLCRGPHLPTTRRIPAFKVHALGRGVLARQREEPAAPADLRHRLGVQGRARPSTCGCWPRRRSATTAGSAPSWTCSRFPDELGSGLAVFHPKGGIIRREMEDYSRRRHEQAGYEFVNTPHITKEDLFLTSGHLPSYADTMFPPISFEGANYYLKPMNCPFHILIYRSRGRSYRELPLRLFEFGTVYRYEKSGVVHGLTRVRGLTQDDAHIFCTREQMPDELDSLLGFVLDLLKDYGLNDFYLELSTRATRTKFIGAPEQWEEATAALATAAEKSGLELVPDPGGAAFYGPKISVQARDAIGRTWQMSTIQVDSNCRSGSSWSTRPPTAPGSGR